MQLDTYKTAPREDFPRFVPHPLLWDRHLMTIAPAFWPRRLRLAHQPGEPRLFSVEPGAQVRGYCHWQEKRWQHGTLILLHGLEGSSESHYILGTAEKALSAGLNVVRLNMRNCDGDLALNRSLYNSGMSGDILAVARELRERDRLEQIFLAGWSMGGNIVLKAAGELAAGGTETLSAVAVVSPSLDLAACVDALETGFNRLYEANFLRGLKAKLRAKTRLFPDLYDDRPLPGIRSIRAFDDTYTAPLGGYGTAERYYREASALRVVTQSRVPTLIIQAKDDPFVPFTSFRSPDLQTPHISLLVTDHGGHAGFIHKSVEGPPFMDRFWAENRVVEFCQKYLPPRPPASVD